MTRRLRQRTLPAMALLFSVPHCSSEEALRPPPVRPVEAPGPGATSASGCERDRQDERERLVRSLKFGGISNQRVLDALGRVPRHRFVPEDERAAAYEDRALPIGNGQTISQPFVVAAMTAAANPAPTDRCLEIGTGSGYQAAVLGELCRRVYSIEYLPEVAQLGQHNLRRCGYDEQRIVLRVGDGYGGWPEAAPFDVVMITAAPEHVPPRLLEQLRVGGRLVIPVGPQRVGQTLELWLRTGTNGGPADFKHQQLLDVRFVPMLGEAERKTRP